MLIFFGKYEDPSLSPKGGGSARGTHLTPFSSKVLCQPSKVTILMWGMPKRRGQKAQSAGDPESDHDGNGYDTFVDRIGLSPRCNTGNLTVIIARGRYHSKRKRFLRTIVYTSPVFCSCHS